MEVILPDGAKREVPDGASFLDLAKDISPGLAKAVLAAKLDGELMDIQAPIPRTGTVELLKADAPEAADIIRHSCEHVMATAVVRLFEGAQVTMGPADHGKDFYYDFDIGRPFTPEDIKKIRAEMKKLIKKNVKFVRKEVPKAEAAAIFEKLGQRFKPEILEWIKDETVTLYEDADFIDLCRGPHVPSAGKIGAFDLSEPAGSYWRGDKDKDPLQRIRGVAFSTNAQLKDYQEKVKLAKERDHRKLGKELGLVGFSPLAPASPFFMPKGAIVYHQMVEYIRGKYQKYGYEEVITPQIYNTDLYRTSGHYDNYQDNMYFAESGKKAEDESEEVQHVEWSVKPMNCPGHCVLYGMTLHSFRDLPWRVADFGRLHRAEGEAVHGLMRVRTFCQDDAHIFCAIEQMQDEMGSFIDLVDEVYGDFGLHDVSVVVATRPPQDKRMGTDAQWDQSERALTDALDAKGRPYTIAEGEGAFYGPKIEFHVQDALGRDWQLGTLQVDFSMPDRFGLEFVGSDGARHTPVMLHRAILGSLERFIGVYIEHTGGAFPEWLAPVQAVVLPVTDRAHAHAQSVADALAARGIRVDVDARNEKLGRKIKEARTAKIPFRVVVGDQEVESGGVAITRRGEREAQNLTLSEGIGLIADAARMPGPAEK